MSIRGIPQARRGTAAQAATKATAQEVDNAYKRVRARTARVIFENTGANPLRIFFTTPPLTMDGENYWDLAASGKLEVEGETDGIWLAGVGGTTTFQMIVCERVF